MEMVDKSADRQGEAEGGGGMPEAAGESAILAECEKRFGFRVEGAEVIRLGWLNEKRILATNRGRFVLKKLHAKRYEGAGTLRRTLLQQQRLHRAGIPCPLLLEADGEALQTSASGELYFVMQHCEGRHVRAGEAGASQMYDLGRTAGAMHRLLNDGSLAAPPKPQFVPPDRRLRLAHWDDVTERALLGGQEELVPAIERQRRATELLDPAELEARCLKGWAHRDLWMDNLLFGGDLVSAVLDFDRLNYDYPELDVARAVMSGAFCDGELHLEKTKAFLRGYRERYPYPAGQLAVSLRLLWYLESAWWIHERMDKAHAIPARFAEEMSWLASRADRLDEMLGSI